MNDDDFVALINESVPLWLEEFKDVIDKRLLWDLIKFKFARENYQLKNVTKVFLKVTIHQAMTD